jgi:hypothetical protein
MTTHRPAHDAFICHASEDKAVADTVCAMLEQSRVRCWIAPRDVLPGIPYGEALSDAIEKSRLLVLVLSSHANKSSHVMREVEVAVSHGVPILPFRIEAVEPSKALSYFVRAIHWLDAFTPPLQKHLTELSETVRTLLKKLAVSAPAPVAIGVKPPPLPVVLPAQPKRPLAAPIQKVKAAKTRPVEVLPVLQLAAPPRRRAPVRREPEPAEGGKSGRVFLTMFLILVLIGLVVLGGFFVLHWGKPAAAGKELNTTSKEPSRTDGRLEFGKNDRIKLDGELTEFDPMHPTLTGPRTHCKVYLISLGAGRRYRFDMISKELDSYLLLEDDDGNALNEDDNSGGDRNARMFFICRRSGVYHLVATESGDRGWARVGHFSLEVQDITFSKSAEKK